MKIITKLQTFYCFQLLQILRCEIFIDEKCKMLDKIFYYLINLKNIDTINKVHLHNINVFKLLLGQVNIFERGKIAIL